MRRRDFLASTIAAGALSAFSPRPTSAPAVDWEPLRRSLGERLIPGESPLPRLSGARGAEADAFFRRVKNPYFLSDEPGLTQTFGWVDAWTTQPSLMAVAAESADDVAAALRFARRFGVPLAVKGGGHSYFGNSNRAGSLLIWTRRLRSIEVHAGFRPTGAPSREPVVPAVSVGAGTLWGEVYRTVAREHGRYVQGGGCFTVGTAGFIQGGGFGSFSKRFGTGAANLIEAEVVTADGRVRVVNRWRDPELYFALRGGGGGTFGVATRLTVQTHDLPASMGAILFSVTAADEASWKELIARTIDFYTTALFNPTWGEQLRFSPGRRMEVSMLCHGISEAQIRSTWAPLLHSLEAEPGRFRFERDPVVLSVPGRQFWDPDYLRRLPGIVLTDDRPGASPDNIFWATNLGEAAQVLHAYQSRWLPSSLLTGAQRSRLVDALVSASAEWGVTLHTNKGLAGGSTEALRATRETATNPDVLEAFALLICGAQQEPAWPGIAGHEPDMVRGRREAEQVRRAMRWINAIAPGAGSYMSEADYFEPHWKQAFWGSNYPRLSAAKRRYDPGWLFRGHKAVEPA